MNWGMISHGFFFGLGFWVAERLVTGLVKLLVMLVASSRRGEQ